MSTTPHSGSDREIQRELERAKSEATQLASDAAETAKRRGHQAADRAKEIAAERAEEFASALESGADDLESSETGEMLSGYGRSMAELMRRFAGGLRENEIEDFAGQLAGFARRNPASFLAGSVAIGFGVSRFLKATSARSIEEYGYDDEDEYLLDVEDDFDFEESGTAASSGTDYGASSGADYASSSDYGSSSRSDYGRPAGNEYGTSGTSSSSSYGASAAGDLKQGDSDTWPQDRGRERPGAGSETDHWSPSVSADSSKRSGQSTLSSDTDITAPGGSTGTDTSGKGRDDSRKDDLRRNEP